MNRIQDTPQRRPAKPLKKSILDTYGSRTALKPSAIPAQSKSAGNGGRFCSHTIDAAGCPCRTAFLAELLAKRGWA